MKAAIHPKYDFATVTCACGAVYKVRSTKPAMRADICARCHPFYTGSRRFESAGGRIERFRKKYGL